MRLFDKKRATLSSGLIQKFGHVEGGDDSGDERTRLCNSGQLGVQRAQNTIFHVGALELCEFFTFSFRYIEIYTCLETQNDG